MRKGSPVFLILLGFFSLFMAMRHPRFEGIPTVLVLQLLISGVCFGIGIAVLVLLMRAKNKAS